jgi:hypothetical protein
MDLNNKPSTTNSYDTDIIIELHPYEMQLIRQLRNNFRFGEIVILVREGLPYRLKRVTEFSDLDTKGKL